MKVRAKHTFRHDDVCITEGCVGTVVHSDATSIRVCWRRGSQNGAPDIYTRHETSHDALPSMLEHAS